MARDEISVGRGVRRLLQLPEIFAQPGHGRRGIEDDLRAVEAQAARALGKMAVVADIDADLGEAQIEDRIAEVAGPEVELLPEAGRDVRNVGLAIFAEILAVVVDARRRCCSRRLPVRPHKPARSARCRSSLASDCIRLDRGAVGNRLGGVVPAWVIARRRSRGR